MVAAPWQPRERPLRFRILGPLEVDGGGAPVAVGGPKPRALLAALLVHRGTVVSVDRLVDALWGERPPPGATAALRAYLSRLRAALGDPAQLRTTLQITGENLCEAAGIEAGQAVLDVAAGNGNAAPAAARRGAVVTAVDYVPALLQAGKGRADADGLTVDWREGDAEALPLDAGTYDAVLSVFGVMFTPNQERAAAELLWMCRPGGRIGVVSWTPDSFIGQMFRIVGRYVPPPAGVRSPLEWGTESRLAELFGEGVSGISARRRTFHFRYRSARDWLTTFRTYYGPVARAFAAIDEAAQRSFEHDLLDLATRFNTSNAGVLQIPSEFLEAVAVRASSGPRSDGGARVNALDAAASPLTSSRPCAKTISGTPTRHAVTTPRAPACSPRTCWCPPSTASPNSPATAGPWNSRSAPAGLPSPWPSAESGSPASSSPLP